MRAGASPAEAGLEVMARVAPVPGDRLPGVRDDLFHQPAGKAAAPVFVDPAALLERAFFEDRDRGRPNGSPLPHQAPRLILYKMYLNVF